MLRAPRSDSRFDRLRSSKFGNLFSRKKRTHHIPDDLCDAQVTPPLQQTEFCLTKATDVSAYEECFKTVPNAMPSSKSMQSTIICDVLQVKEIVQVDILESKAEVKPRHDSQDTAFGPLVIDDLDAKEKARNVHADMLNAISQALARNKQSKLGASVLGAVQPAAADDDVIEDPAVQMLESFCVEDVIIPHTKSESITEQQDQSTYALRLKNSPPSLSRRHSYDDHRDIEPSRNHEQEASQYAKRSLPVTPTSYLRPGFNRRISRKCAVSKRQLRKAEFHQSWSRDTRVARRRACSAPIRPRADVAETVSTTASAEGPANVNHLLGLLLFWYWLAAGRRFFHKASIDKLHIPGSRCLAIEYGIIGFKTGFPNASMDIYRSANQPNQDPTKPRYAKLPYADNTFDVISSLGLAVSVMTKDWPATLAELKRILKPGGHLEFQAFSTTWINAGPSMVEQQTEYANKLRLDGFCGEIVKTLPHYLSGANFEQVNLAHLAIPGSWGGRVSSVFSKFYEPLRLLREKQTLCDWSSEQRKKTAEEQVAYRSSRGLLLIVAVK